MIVKIINFILDYLSNNLNWIAPLVVGLLAIRLSRKTIQASLFDRKAQIYEKINAFIPKEIQDDSISKLHKLRAEISNRHFILSDKLNHYIDNEIIKKYEECWELCYHNYGDLEVGEKRDKRIGNASAIRMHLSKQIQLKNEKSILLDKFKEEIKI